MSVGRPVVQPSASAEVSGPPMEDDREVLSKGIEAVGSAVATKPILGSYLPVNPVQRSVILSGRERGRW